MLQPLDKSVRYLGTDCVEGVKVKVRLQKKILGKAENGWIELGSIKNSKDVVGKEVKLKDTSSFRIKGTTACLK